MDFDHKVGAFDDEGLVAADKEKKDWKGIVISLLVIGNIMGAIIVAIVLCTPDGDMDANKAKLEFDVLVSDQFKVQAFNGTWLSDHEIVYVDQNGSIVIFDAASNSSSSMLVKTYDKTLHTMGGFKLSSDRQSILFVSEMRYEFGAPISARYAIFNISSQTVDFLDDLIKSSWSSGASSAPTRTPHIQYAAWGPVSNSIVFIESSDIYYVPDFSASTTTSTSGDSSSSSVAADNGGVKYLRLTSSGAAGDVSNGLPDSLYRSSIFTEPNEATLWWSQDGRYLAYLSFDDSQVEANPIEYYDTYLQSSDPIEQQANSNNNNNNYSPKIHYEKYPRAGGTNPRVSLRVVDLKALATGSEESSSSSSSGESNSTAAQLETRTIEPPSELIKQQQADARLVPYITHVAWFDSDANQLLVMWSNRAQSVSMLSLCENSNERHQSGSMFSSRLSPASWKCNLLTSFSQRIPPSANAKRIILSATNANGTRLVFFALPRPDSIIGDHYHVAMLRGEERAPKYLTYGEFDIDRLISYDQRTDSLYFEAKIGEKAERHLYRIAQINSLAARQTKCLTCELDEPCGYNNVHIAPNSKYLVHECLGPSVPRTYLRSLVAHSNGLPFNGSRDGAVSNNVTQGKPLGAIALLGSNPNIENLLRQKQMPVEKFIAIKSNQQVPCDVYVKMYLPTEIEEEKDKRFPLLIESSEIDQRNVWKRFDLDWGKYLASKKQIIYAKMDCIKTRSSAASFQPATGSSASGSSRRPPVTGAGGSLQDDDQLLSNSPLFNAKDQVDAIKFMADNLDLFPYIDRRRIAIWGPNSASAYVALATTINDDSKLIQCTVAISPITNWRYMNSFEAEHYLGLPWLDTNSLKYEQANLLRRSYEFSLRKLLIVHGTADEQVHVQHSMQFIKSLTEHHITGGVLHQMQLYPDVGHSLDQVRRHLFLTLDGFVDRCFYQKPIAIKATEWKGKVRPKLY